MKALKLAPETEVDVNRAIWIDKLKTTKRPQVTYSYVLGDARCATGLITDDILSRGEWMHSSFGIPWKVVCRFLGIERPAVERIIQENDLHKMTFPQIAEKAETGGYW